MPGGVRKSNQPHHAAAELVELRRTEGAGVVDVAEGRPVRRRPVERGPDAASHGVRPGAVEVAVEAIFAGRQLVVDPGAELIAVAPPLRHEERTADIEDPVGRTDHVGAGRRAAEIAEVRGRIDRRRKVPHQLRRDAVRPRLQDEVAEFGSLDRERRAARPGLPQPFVRREEEDAVLRDRPAQAVAELVLAEFGDRGLEHVLRRQLVAGEIVGAAAAELVRARLGDHLDLRARIAAVHGREVVRHHANLFDRLGVRREVGDAAARDPVGAGVVDGEIVRLVALAAGVDARRGFTGKRIVGSAAAADRRGEPAPGDARLEREQVVEVPAAERHLLQQRAIDAAGHPALLRLDERRLRFDRHALGDPRYLEREVEAQGLADPEAQVLASRLQESRLLDLDGVHAGAQAGHAVDAIRGRRHFAGDAGRGVRDAHDRVGNEGLLCVGDGALKGAAELRGRGERRDQQDEREQRRQPERSCKGHRASFRGRPVPPKPVPHAAAL